MSISENEIHAVKVALLHIVGAIIAVRRVAITLSKSNLSLDPNERIEVDRAIEASIKEIDEFLETVEKIRPEEPTNG